MLPSPERRGMTRDWTLSPQQCHSAPHRTFVSTRDARHPANTRNRLPMPLRLASCLCAALLLIVLAAGGQSAVPASGHWQAVLAAGDRAEPVFDNAVAALS
jgi:hypothetical protein